MTAEPAITGREHWVKKGPVRLFLWEKAVGTSPGPRGAVLFVHGSSMASQPTFDLQIQGHPDASAMDYFTRLGYDTWCLDMEGYGRTYVDMCAKLPVVDPARITVPTIVMRGQYDGIAGFADLLEFFTRLPNPDKQFAVMAGIAHASFQQTNFRIAYHILHSVFSQPAPIYRGE